MSNALAIELPLGIPGVTSHARFELRSRAEGSAYMWLNSGSDAAVVLLAVDVLRLEPGYPIDQVRRNVAFLHLDDDEPLMVLALCTVPSKPEPATANLLAPIVVGLRSRRAAQIVLHDQRWSDHTPLPS